MTIPCTWRKSSRSSGQDTCVAVRSDLGALRDTKQRGGPQLSGDVRALVTWVRSGRLG